jgi:PAS domain S-box-containing protein
LALADWIDNKIKIRLDYMQAFIDLFSYKDLIPHGYCLAWSPLLLWLTVISDLLITLAYYSIPLTILYFLYKRKCKQSHYNWIGVLFATFILACGTTHLLSTITIWIPLYWLDGFLKAFTALISVATALSMLWVVPRVLSLPTQSQLDGERQQRHYAENNLLNSSHTFNKIASRVPGMVYQFYLSSDGKAAFPFVSEGIYELFRVKPEEVREDASQIFALIHPEDFDGFFASIEMAVNNLAPWFYEFRVKHNDGTINWLSGNSLPDQDDFGVWYWYGFMSDITVQKQLAENLRISENMKRAILESSQDAIFSVDNDGLIKNYNPSTLSTFGYTHQDIHEKNWIDLFIAETFRDNDLLNHSKYTENLKDSGVNSRIELMGCRGNEEFPIEISITPIRIGSLNFFSVFIRDISERKQAEAVLRDGQQQAEQANLVKSQFLAMMSHEIRTPLNAVLGMQELLTHTPLNHVQSDYLKLATQSGKNLLAIVNDILDLTKVEAGKLELEQIPFDVIEITQHCVELLRLTAQAKDLSLITVIAPELNVWISGDPLRYQQVLTNLLSNAIKFTNTGSITIKLSAQSSAEDSSALLVEVIDTGLGIPLASQADLFEVFIQVDPSDTRKHGGSGLGLAISKRLVALWEGHIGVESTPNVGSRFWFTVGSEAIAPVLTITSALNKGDEAAHPAFSANILVVDDSPINQLVMAYMLRNAGYHVDLADSGSAGIAAVKKRHYDIILMDVSMPDMSGMEATTIIRQLSGAAAVVPIIAITAHALAGYQALCLAAGMNGYATKPISQKDLLAVVATWCDKTITRDAPALSALIEDSSVQSVYEPVKQAVILDQASLDALTSLLGQEAFNDLLQTYQTELTTRCDAIKQAIIQQDLIIISREAHTIKSSSANFGATALTAIAKDLEACGYNNDLPQALILAEQLLPCAAATLATMSSI